MNLHSHAQHVQGLEFQDSGDEVLVHDPHSRKIHVLNRTAAAILRQCNGAAVAEVVDSIAASHPEERPTIERDVTTILEDFQRLGLITLDVGNEHTAG